VAKKLLKLYDPIGLGGVEKLELFYVDGDRILRESIDKAYVPHDGELWLFIEASFGKWNGPKRQYKLLTDGDEIIDANWVGTTQGSTFGVGGWTNSADVLHAIKHKRPLDKDIEEFVRSKIISEVFE